MKRSVLKSALRFRPVDAVQPLEARLLFDAQQPAALLSAAPAPSTPAVLVPATNTLAAATASVTSSLWGSAGETWPPAGRLIDYPYPGYHNGDDPIPTTYATTRNVADY